MEWEFKDDTHISDLNNQIIKIEVENIGGCTGVYRGQGEEDLVTFWLRSFGGHPNGNVHYTSGHSGTG